MPSPVYDIELRYWDGLRKGESESLAWLYNRYFKLLYNYGRKIAADEKALEDGIHDLFVDLWRFRRNLSPTTSVQFYLYRSLRRRLVRNRNGKHLLADAVSIPEDLQRCIPCEEEDIMEREAQDSRVNHLKKMLADLSPRQYEAMILRFYDELSFEEIATIMDVNEQSARNLVHRGLTQLKQFSKLLMAWLLLIG